MRGVARIRLSPPPLPSKPAVQAVPAAATDGTAFPPPGVDRHRVRGRRSGDTRPDPVVTAGRERADGYGEKFVVFPVVSDAEFERRREEREYYVDAPSEATSRVAAEEDVRYFVVGGRRRTPPCKAVFGIATQAVLPKADSPVVAVID